ncbi:MAG: hypothetical protein GY874_07860 [Desulfobacteraceae bacterium]|nr:hypothetical protein [Desulfobacteraceae bacterium]
MRFHFRLFSIFQAMFHSPTPFPPEYFYLNDKLLEFKAVAKAQGASAADLQKLTHRTVIDMMAAAVRPRFKQ